MKKITFTLLTLALLLAACGKEGNKRLDPNATILLRPAKGVKLRSSDNPEHLTALEIVQQTSAMIFCNNMFPGQELIRGFSDAQRDYEIPALKMWGTDIITSRGDYCPEFIEGWDFILLKIDLLKEKRDTIGYIPNTIIRRAQREIKIAYDAGDYDKVYELFHTAFTFRPITGAEWRVLKDSGEQ